MGNQRICEQQFDAAGQCHAFTPLSCVNGYLSSKELQDHIFASLTPIIAYFRQRELASQE